MTKLLMPRPVTRTERRQVIALDLREGNRDLFYLEEGGAEEIRAAAQSGKFVCPICDVPMIVRAGSYRDHFVHLGAKGEEYDHAPESLYHLEGKALIERWVKKYYPAYTVRQEVTLENGRRPDVLVKLPDGQRIAFEVQYSSIDIKQWNDRQKDYDDLGIKVVWLWGHTPPHCKEHYRGKHLVAWKLNGVLRACLKKHDNLFFIDPSESQILEGVSMGVSDKMRYACSVWEEATNKKPSKDLKIWMEKLPRDITEEDNYFIPQAYPIKDCSITWNQGGLATPFSSLVQTASKGVEALTEAPRQLSDLHAARQSKEWNKNRSYWITEGARILSHESQRFEKIPLVKREWFKYLHKNQKEYFKDRHQKWEIFSNNVKAYYDGHIPSMILWRTEGEEDNRMWLYHAHWKSLLCCILEVSKGQKISFNQLTRRLDETRTPDYKKGMHLAWSIKAIVEYMALLDDLGYVKLDQECFYSQINLDKPLISVLHKPNETPDSRSKS